MKLADFKKPETIKLTIAVVLILFACLYLILHLGTLFGRPSSNAIAYYQVFRPAGVDPNKPISTANPVDPTSKFATTSYKFADAQGALRVISYPNDSTRALEVQLDAARTIGQPPWLGQVITISDPAGQALMFAQIRSPWLMRRWLHDAGLNKSQITALAAAHQQFESSMALLTQSEQQDLIDADLLSQLDNALKTFLKIQGDISKAGPKRQTAQSVMELARQYATEVDDQHSKNIATYIDAILGILSDKEKSVLAARFAPILRRYKK